VTAIDMSRPTGMALALLPELLLTGAALVALLVTAWRHRTAADSRFVGLVSLAGVVVAGIGLAVLWGLGATPLEGARMVALDPFRFASLALILVATAATILLSLGYLEREGLLAPEYYPLVLFTAIGMMFLAGAADLIVLFLGLEVMSIAIYVLAGFDRGSRFASEAALKYFLIGAFASAFLLYGIALVYGAAGTTDLGAIARQLQGAPLSFMGLAGLGLLLIGMGFKVAAAPFHMWAPDVYDGAPTPVTTLMATGVKAAAFLALARVLYDAFPHHVSAWSEAVAGLAVLTMIVGNLVALAQRSIKRMLAYSSVAHAGYLLAAVWAGPRDGASPTLLYLAAYVLTTIVTFGILGVVGRGGERDVTVASLAGMGRTRPWVAVALTIGMLSLLGFPGTFGFIGKWAILAAIVDRGAPLLAVILVVTSLVSAGYYLPVVSALWMKPEPAVTGLDALAPSRFALVAIGVAAALTVALGVWPGPALEWAAASARGIGGAAAALAGTVIPP
jgi:NADH-quinone oxidoreductase subunit N